jgi:hypothetical protein
MNFFAALAKGEAKPKLKLRGGQDYGRSVD